MRFVILLTIMLFIGGNAQAGDKKGESSMPAFPAYYAMVSHVLKHDKGCIDQLMANPQRNNISEFWWGYILKECNGYLSNQINRLSERSGSTKSQPETNKELKRQANKLIRQCAMSVIFDNWDRINETIVENHQQVCAVKK